MDETIEQKPKPSWARTLGALYLDVQWISALIGTLTALLGAQQWFFPTLVAGMLIVHGVAHWVWRPTMGEWLSGIARQHLPSGQRRRFVELRIPQVLPRLVYLIGLLQFKAGFEQLGFVILMPEDYFLGVQIGGLWKLCVGFFETTLVVGYTVCFLRMKSYVPLLTTILVGFGGLDLVLNRPYWTRIAELVNHYHTLTSAGRATAMPDELVLVLFLVSSVGSWVLLLVTVLWHRKKFVR